MPSVSFYRWTDMPEETLSPLLGRKLINLEPDRCRVRVSQYDAFVR
jgi:hypothetical protein